MMPPVMKPPIGRNLRYLQSRTGTTWQSLAQTLGVSERLVAAWRKDSETDPSWGNILRLAKHFDVPPEYFYADNSESRGS